MGAQTIVVAGDIAIDWLTYQVPPSDDPKTDNWRGKIGTRAVALPGGALLLARMVRGAIGQVFSTDPPTVVEQSIGGPIENIPPTEVLHSNTTLKQFPSSKAKGNSRRLRVDSFEGFSGPDTGALKCWPVADDAPGASIVVLDDAGNGYRDARGVWPSALTAPGSAPQVVYKIHHPLAAGALWDTLLAGHRARTVAVIDADDLRRRGAQISTRLSWERMAIDCIWQLAYNPALAGFQQWAHLVIRFDLDGAIYVTQNAGETRAVLFYDPRGIETGFRDGFEGRMVGFGCAFTAALTARIAQAGAAAIPAGIKEGILAGRRLLELGFGEAPEIGYPVDKLFQVSDREKAAIGDIVLPPVSGPHAADPNSWCILDHVNALRGVDLPATARTIVEGGTDSLKGVPIGQFGKLQTLDRFEIESFRCIENLIKKYKDEPKADRPLSIAVFGPPGSGKSFGVKAVAAYVAGGEIESIEFNVSQFTEIDDLARAFHRVRDTVLLGKIPLVFFDEFDCRFQGGPLGWLKYFLAPMQDGKFRDGESVHPLGKAVFVFAGGTSATLEEFSCVTTGESAEDTRPEAGGAPNGAQCSRTAFRDAKGPDFVSRIRGFVNVLGPNKVDGRSPEDRYYPLRRAVLLRSMIERSKPELVRGGKAEIDPGVLAALIGISKYKHGARSLEALLDTSVTKGKKHFGQSDLPPKDQLDLHVDGGEFARLVLRDTLFCSVRERLARNFHEYYRKQQKDALPAGAPAMADWEGLSDDDKRTNLEAADHIPVKLKSERYEFRPAPGKPIGPMQFPADVVERLAMLEHERYVGQKLRDGFTHGPVRDAAAKTNPTLVEWGKLDEAEKEKDRDQVRAIPRFMAEVGFEVYLAAGGVAGA